MKWDLEKKGERKSFIPSYCTSWVENSGICMGKEFVEGPWGAEITSSTMFGAMRERERGEELREPLGYSSRGLRELMVFWRAVASGPWATVTAETLILYDVPLMRLDKVTLQNNNRNGWKIYTYMYNYVYEHVCHVKVLRMYVPLMFSRVKPW